MDLVPPPTSTFPIRKTPRSRTGCQKCRENKVKCDETHPRCGRCTRLDRECDYTPRPRKKYTRKDRGHHPSPGPSPSTQSESVQGRLSSVASSPAGPPSSVSPECARVLSPLDHAVIHYFRFTLPTLVDSKPPEHSGPAIVWVLAEKDPMVMHSVCALAGRKLCEREAFPADEARARLSLAVEHYTAGLRLLHGAVQDGDRSSDMNYILATLWLTMAYEQQFGDGCGVGLSAHLQGAASLLRGRIRQDLEVVLTKGGLSGDGDGWLQEALELEGAISPLTCRLIVWIALVDGGAAINGLGGAFNKLLGQCLFDQDKDSVISWLKGFNALQRRSDLVNAEVLAPLYSQGELVEDLQSSHLFCLQAESGQLRFILSELSTIASLHADDLETQTQAAGCAIHDVGTRYSELLRTASLLNLQEMDSLRQTRFVINLRFIASLYHPVVLCFSRISHEKAALTSKQRLALREIMSLASKAHKDQGDEGMIRFAWPLFVAALESDDMIHRSWILERYDALAARSENFRRARDALHVAFHEQELNGLPVVYTELVRRGDIDRFVIE
ncbi:Zn(2)-C6 fungal-type domain-containing protein [Fusarium sp. LHS14.1]|nr:Zn(2)-C6 fungal-type domain-containing protein [Fusarium sp. LHS14.1]